MLIARKVFAAKLGNRAMRRRQHFGLRLGAAASELAVLLPFFGFLFVTALDFCRIYHATEVLQNSALSAAMYASGSAKSATAIGKIEAAKQAAVADAGGLQPPLQTSDVHIEFAGNVTTTTIRYEFHLLLPFWHDSNKVMLERKAVVEVAPAPGN